MLLKGLGTRTMTRCGLVLAVLCTALFFATPVSAGSYNVYPESGSGTLTISYPGGGGSSTSLSSPDIYQTMSGGTLSYSYSETWRYSWEPEDEYEDDFPVAAVYGVYGTAQWDFWGNSGSWYEGGTASGSASMGSSTASASMTVAQGGSITEQVNVGIPQQLYVEEFLSGWDGTFTIAYTGTMTLASVMDGTISITRGGTSVPMNKYIYITAPARNSLLQGGDQVVFIHGVWKNPQTSTSGDYRVRLNPGNTGLTEPTYFFIGLSVYAPNVWNTWSFERIYNPGGPHQVNAALEYKDASGNFISGSAPSPAAWWTETRFTVGPNP